MRPLTKDKLQELQTVIGRMPIQMCGTMAVQEFGVRWTEVSKAIRNSRLPMVPSSVARVLSRHAVGSFTHEEVEHIVNKLKLKLVAIQDRKWHVVDLLDPWDMPAERLISELPARVAQALRHNRKIKARPDIHTTVLNDLLYFSVQLVSDRRAGPALFVCSPPGAPVAMVSSLTSPLLGACAQGLGYQRYEDAKLFGKDIPSLLQIHNKGWTANVECLDEVPDYNPVPTITANGIDYTNRTYNLQYVDAILGPNPPLLTEVSIESTKPFFDPSRLKRVMNVRILLKSQDVAKTLRGWVERGALQPTSELFTIFTKIKGNRLAMNDDDDDMQ